MKIKMITFLALVTMILSACTRLTVEDDNNKKVEISYSNLVSPKSQKLVDDILAEAGVSAERRQVFFDHVNQFNEAVDSSKLVADFVEKDPAEKFYDPYAFQEDWAKKYPDFEGYNCRITSFNLFGDLVAINGQGDIRANELFLDEMALESDPSGLVGLDKDDFFRLFSTIPTTDTTDVNEHVATIQRDWQERGISLKENDKISLITVWYHDQISQGENELFIGHTGVLVAHKDYLLFIEKIAFQEPYQATFFNNRQELQDYLIKRYGQEWGQATAKPFVMEGDKLI